MSMDSDFLYALQLQNEINEVSDDSVEEVDFKLPETVKHVKSVKSLNGGNYRSNLDEDFLNRTQNLVHPEWETLDPTPDVHALFSAFDKKFFQSRLKCVTLEWSKRMYSCAGICYSRRNRLGMEVTVRLSEPLLKLRPRKDLVETLLHEMIHAYCFVLNIREGNGGHGPNFKKIMHSINKVAGTNITVYHTFHDEVEIYKQHWWRCNGICQNRSPFFGYVKRTCNRAPGPNDQWWAAHQESCSGTFMKIKGPDSSNKENRKKKNMGGDLREIFGVKNSKNHGHTVLGSKTTNSSSIITKPVSSSASVSKAFPSTSYPVSSWDPLNTNKIANTTEPGQSIASIATVLPPSSYPGPSWDPLSSGKSGLGNTIHSKNTVFAGNLANVKGLCDINEGTTKNSNTSISFSPTCGYLLGSDKNGSTNEVDRELMREIRSKKFEKKQNENESTINIEEQNKRRRMNCDEVQLTDKRICLRNNWEIIDDEIMVKEITNEVIDLSSDVEDDDVQIIEMTKTPKIKLTQEERQIAIKQEIMDDDNIGVRSEDIILIDDEYDETQENLTAAVELADTSLIDEFFGEDTMLTEFHNENDLIAWGSEQTSTASQEIITCPICQSKLQRKLLGNHLDGCTGIAIHLKPDLSFFKKISPSLETKRKKKIKKSTSSKDLLRKAGYTEKDLLDITLTDDDDFGILNTSSSSSTLGVSPPEIMDCDRDTRRFRQRNLYKTTQQCPKCGQEVKKDWISIHLDDCLQK